MYGINTSIRKEVTDEQWTYNLNQLGISPEYTYAHHSKFTNKTEPVRLRKHLPNVKRIIPPSTFPKS